MALKPIPGYGKPPKKASYLSYGGVTPGGYTPVKTAVVPSMGPAADRTDYLPPGFTAPTFKSSGSSVLPIVPSYQSELQGDYMYDPTMKAFNDALQGSRDSLRDQIRQAVIRSGYDIRGHAPSSLASYLGDIDPTTIASADANQFSDKAVLQRQVDTGLSDLAYSLAGRGTSRSGALAAGTGGIQQSAQEAQNEQMNTLLNALGQGVGAYQDVSSNALSGRNAALAAIADRLSRQPGATYDTSGGDGGGGGGGGGGGAPAALGPSDMPWLPGISDAQKGLMAGNTTGPSGVDWGGQTFYTQNSLGRYLKARGTNLASWIAGHKDAWARLQP
jgi:hypothetical protein